MSDNIDQRLRRWSRWAAVVFALQGALQLTAFLLWLLFTDSAATKALFLNEVRAIVGIPLAALTAFCVVTNLQATSGDIKFSGLTFTFEGAAGPVVLWVMCFLAVILSIVALWR